MHGPRGVYAALRGYRHARAGFGRSIAPTDAARDCEPNRLESYFDGHIEGPGIFKWRHYFEVYERHLAKFVGRDVRVAEIGVFGGGSLAMWRDYFGEHSHVYGIDREPGCRIHAGPGIDVIVGDQASATFWQRFRAEVPCLDVVIDDGGHEPHQQIATLEGALAHIQPGGVYICEDVLGAFQPFHSYIDGLSRRLHNVDGDALGVHQHIKSIHTYPGIIVIEKPDLPIPAFEAQKRGDDWRPF